jgi:hypothetical protein
MSEPKQYIDRGILFTSFYKKKDNDPDKHGSAEIKCPGCQLVTKFNLSAWIKPGKKEGVTFYSIAFNQDVPKTVPGCSPANQKAETEAVPPADKSELGNVAY